MRSLNKMTQGFSHNCKLKGKFLGSEESGIKCIFSQEQKQTNMSTRTNKRFTIINTNIGYNTHRITYEYSFCSGSAVFEHCAFLPCFSVIFIDRRNYGETFDGIMEWNSLAPMFGRWPYFCLHSSFCMENLGKWNSRHDDVIMTYSFRQPFNWSIQLVL